MYTHVYTVCRVWTNITPNQPAIRPAPGPARHPDKFVGEQSKASAESKGGDCGPAPSNSTSTVAHYFHLRYTTALPSIGPHKRSIAFTLSLNCPMTHTTAKATGIGCRGWSSERRRSRPRRRERNGKFSPRVFSTSPNDRPLRLDKNTRGL